MMAKDESGTGRPGVGSSRRAASLAASARSCSRSGPSALMMRLSKSWSTTPRPNSCSRRRPLPESTSILPGGPSPDSRERGALAEAGSALYQHDRAATGTCLAYGRSRVLEQCFALNQPRRYFVR